MRETKIILVSLVAAALLGGILGCEEELGSSPPSQSEWTEMGWDAWENGDLDTAERYFGNALKIDENYTPAYNGLGWTYMRKQELTSAMDSFEDALIYAAGLPNSDAEKRCIYVGLAYALEAADEFNESVIAGETYVGMDPNGTWEHSYVDFLDAYDARLVLVLDYFALGNSGKCVEHIRVMQTIIGDSPPYTFTNWADLAAKIEFLVENNP